MTTLSGLEASERAADLIDRLQPRTPVGLFDNRDTWDNVGGGPWDNRSTWDNWKKQGNPVQTAEIRGAKVLLPSDDEPAVRAWPYPNPLEEEKVTNIHFASLDLTSHRLVDVTLSRCRFTGSRLMGVSLARVAMTDVLFEGCQFDYASWEQVKITGDVAFVGCSFKEAEIIGSDLRDAVFDDCTFAADIKNTKMSGTDLRGSDLSNLSGLASLHGAKVTEIQLRQLSEVMIRDLGLTIAEIPLQAGRHQQEWLHPLFHLVVKGLRRGEAVGLPWSNTRLTDAEADIRTQVVQLSWQTFTSTPKSEAGQRTITLDADTVKVLRGWKKFQNQARLQAGAEWADSGLVFTRQDGQGWHPSHVSDWFARIARAAGLPPITLHGLRHGAASIALAAGTDVKVVSAELGHSTTHFTQDTYQTVFPEVAKAAAEATAALLRGTTAPVSGLVPVR